MNALPSSAVEADIARTVGLTTTVPVEIIYAAGLVPLDLNNVFIASEHCLEMVETAERAGFPKNSCCWVKGIYAAAKELGLKRLVAVVEGDCSNTHALAEMLQSEGVEVVPFAYPFGRDASLLELHLRRFAAAFGVTIEEAETWKEKLDGLRALAHRIDALNWREGLATAWESHLYAISCSDFLCEPQRYEADATRCINEARTRRPRSPRHRLALLGIPPICGGLFELLEARGAEIVFNEVPRQFSMPERGRTLVEQYRRYTYPYDVFGRIEDMRRQVKLRRIEGAIHYVQSFCFRQVQDVLIRRALGVPILTLECDRPGPLDSRTITRVEAFVEMLSTAGQ